jgi:hypothetical protein
LEASIFTNEDDQYQKIKNAICGEILQNFERYRFVGISPLQYVFELQFDKRNAGFAEVAGGVHALGVNIILEKWDSQVYYAPYLPLKRSNTVCIGVYKVKKDLKFLALDMPQGHQFYDRVEKRSKMTFIHNF